MARVDTAVAERFVARADQLDQLDGGWRDHMAQISDVIRPLRRELRGARGPEGEKRMNRVYDGTAMNAAGNLAAGLYGTGTNQAENWLSLSLVDKDRTKWGPNRDWLNRQSKKLLASFGPTYSGFYAQVASLYLDLAAFGTAVFSSELRPDHSGFIDLSRSLASHNFDVDPEGRVNSMYVRRRMTVENAAREFGKENLSDKLRGKLDSRERCETDLLQAVVPNDGLIAGLAGWGKKFAKLVIEAETKHVVQQQGFKSFPYFVPRWEVAEGERKGRGPGEKALPDTKSLNVMRKANLKAGEMAGDPPWGGPDEGNVPVSRIRPGNYVPGSFDRRGNQLVAPLLTGGQSPFSLEMEQALQATIKDYFYFSLLQLVGRSGMSTVEVIERNEEKQRLMAPYLGRIQAEFLAPLVMRRWELLQQVPGVIDAPPPDLAGHTIEVEFVSAAALAQKSARAAGVLRFVQVAEPIMALDPMARARFNGDKALQTVAEAVAVPEVLHDDETTDKNRQAIQQQMQMASAAETMPQMADAADKGASAVARLKGDGKAAA